MIVLEASIHSSWLSLVHAPSSVPLHSTLANPSQGLGNQSDWEYNPVTISLIHHSQKEFAFQKRASESKRVFAFVAHYSDCSLDIFGEWKTMELYKPEVYVVKIYTRPEHLR